MNKHLGSSVAKIKYYLKSCQERSGFGRHDADKYKW